MKIYKFRSFKIIILVSILQRYRKHRFLFEMGLKLCKPESINFKGRCQSACCGGNIHNETDGGRQTFKRTLLRFKKSSGVHKQGKDLPGSKKENSQHSEERC